MKDEELYGFLEMKGSRIITKYPNVKELAEKDQLSKMVDMASKVSEHGPQAMDFIPRTFVFPK